MRTRRFSPALSGVARSARQPASLACARRNQSGRSAPQPLQVMRTRRSSPALSGVARSARQPASLACAR